MGGLADLQALETLHWCPEGTVADFRVPGSECGAVDATQADSELFGLRIAREVWRMSKAAGALLCLCLIKVAAPACKEPEVVGALSCGGGCS
jgi:hypothetical protein